MVEKKVVPALCPALLPATAKDVVQELELPANDLRVSTTAKLGGLHLHSTASVAASHPNPKCVITAQATAGQGGGWLAIVVRPYNPEGVSLIDKIVFSERGKAWAVNGVPAIASENEPDRLFTSNYEEGDVFYKLPSGQQSESAECPAGMAHGAALYRLPPGENRRVDLNVDLQLDPASEPKKKILSEHDRSVQEWSTVLDGTAQLAVSDDRIQHLYDIAVRSLILHTPGTVYPGPYTYKRFWFRDAAFILHPLIAIGLHDRAREILDTFPDRQHITGYFCSQNGEWDSNGQVLWILDRYLELSGKSLPPKWASMVAQGAKWICRKRLPMSPETPQAGLMPAGFSAEHLGPNDYYYWDTFWSIAGLRVAARLLQKSEKHAGQADHFKAQADEMAAAADRSIQQATKRLGVKAIPAAPSRRMDSGAVGSIVAGYPVNLLDSYDERLLGTVEFLMDKCFVGGGLFQDMIHSGINAYLTLHIAQQMLRAGDPRFAELVQNVADLASPTGQWPAAIHPATGGGCMGDGHHAWASAEWVMMIRNIFVREEGETLILLSGLPSDCVPRDGKSSYGPTSTRFGPISVDVQWQGDDMLAEWNLDALGEVPRTTIQMPGFNPVETQEPKGKTVLQQSSSSPGRLAETASTSQ